MALPNELLESLSLAPGFNRKEFESVHENAAAITSLRLNPSRKVDIHSIPYVDEQIPWSSQGYYLSQRPLFILDPLIHAGAYYVQEASSMFLEQAIRQTCDLSGDLKVLDLCAAPGGKSTLIHSLLNNSSLLVSNEVIKSRVQVLEENMTKWGAGNVVVTNNDPRDFQSLPNYFDLMLVDAPCSGSGLFRRDPGAVAEWSPAGVDLCSQRQQRILSDALPALKEGGVLVYSTCSYSLQEDEDIADWLIKEHHLEPLELQVEKSWNIVSSTSPGGGFGYRFYPDKLKGEGFFISCFRKKEENEKKIPKPVKIEKASKTEMAVIAPFIEQDQLLTWRFGDRILSFPLQLERELGVLMSGLYIRKAGVSLGKLAGKDLIPDHELALSTILESSVPSVEVDRAQALKYLRRDELSLDTTLKGWVLVRYEGLGLGWVKALPNRINNYYPKEWRILKSSDN